MRKAITVALLVSACVHSAGSRSFLERPSPSNVRVMTWNVGSDSMFEGADRGGSSPERAEGFRRVMQAIRPDVVCLQEVHRGFAAAGLRLDEVLPLEGGARWQTFGAFDVVIASRWPLSMQDARVLEQPPRKRAHTVALIDLPGDRDLYSVCAHVQSRAGAENIAFRQLQSDMIVAWLRDARTPGGDVDIPKGTPLVLAGDFNVVPSDPGNHLRTLLTGDVFDDARFGPDAPPDWDGTPLVDLLPRHNRDGAEDWTWRFDAEGFVPSALDRIIVSDSVLRVENAFVLNTRTMSPADRQRAGLRPDDVMRDERNDNYDHLPIVADLAVTAER
jgi:endonuclease/exonuclease/phosphatase family metal-dependent hydrolase